jgi:hypothetical protein
MRIPFYFPGIVSLIGIPLALLYFQFQVNKRQNLWAIPLITSDRDFFENNQSVFAAFRGNFVPKRMYEDFTVGKNEKENIKQLKDAMTLIRGINSECDTLNGAHFHFGSKSQYGDFVRVIDSLRMSKVKSFMTYESEIWVYMLPKLDDEKGKELVWLECVSGRMIVREEKTLNKGRFMLSLSNAILIMLYIFMATLHFRTAATTALSNARAESIR